MKVVVLGAGLVGGPVAADLAPDFKVVAADLNQSSLDRLTMIDGIETIRADISDADTIKSLLDGADYAVNAIPGSMGYATLKNIINAGVNAIDIAFMSEDVLQLNELARAHNCIVISDMGVAPGMSNLLAGYAGTLLDRFDQLKIVVGGLPKDRTWPWQYKAVFSPADVIEEYTRTARLVRNGNIVELPALTEPEFINIAGVGTLEAFNSDGLRSLIHTLDVPDMVEKTMRYPGHSELMRVLAHAGFFSISEIKVDGKMISPLAVTSNLLFLQWKLNEGEEDLTVMRITATGLKNGRKTTITWNLFDAYNRETGVHSMARTTGYAATAALRMLTRGMFNYPGVHVPEFIGQHHECVRFMLDEQQKRGVVYTESIITE